LVSSTSSLCLATRVEHPCRSKSPVVLLQRGFIDGTAAHVDASSNSPLFASTRKHLCLKAALTLPVLNRRHFDLIAKSGESLFPARMHRRKRLQIDETLAASFSLAIKFDARDFGLEKTLGFRATQVVLFSFPIAHLHRAGHRVWGNETVPSDATARP